MSAALEQNPEPLPESSPETLIDLRAEFRRRGELEEFLTGLDRDLVGLKPVKARIREIASLLLIERVRQRLGFATRERQRCICRSPAIRAPAKPPWPCGWRAF